MRIVKSVRVNGKPSHKTLYSLGKVEDYSPQQLENMAKKLLKAAGRKLDDIFPQKIQEQNRLNYGYALVIKKLWKIFDLDKLQRSIRRKTKTRFDWVNVLQIMLAERISDPASKRQNYFNASDYIGFNPDVKLQHFYRTLDILADNKELIKQHIAKQRQNLFSHTLDVVFYDVTTLYFDSQKEDAGNLRQKGYSKDGKIHKTQIVLGLLVDQLRNPITYNLYPGNTYEGHTLVEALEDLQRNYPIGECTLVADSAMINKNNRKLLNEKGISYIIGERLKNLPRKIIAELLDRTRHKALTEEISQEQFSYREVEFEGRRIICTYSAKRAKKDAYERKKLINKAKELLNQPSFYRQMQKRGASRFIVEEGDSKNLKLDLERIEKESRFDGFKAIATTSSLPASEIIEKYTDLFEVEQSFRALKSQLKIRPVFHWTNKRIEGHVLMSFLAYSFLNYLRTLTRLSYKDLVRTLDKMEVSKIEEADSGDIFYLRSHISEKQKRLQKFLRLTLPSSVTTEIGINQLFN